MADTSHKFNIIGLKIIILLSTLNAFCLSLMIYGIILGLDPYYKSDFNDVFPITPYNENNFLSLLKPFFEIISNNYYIASILLLLICFLTFIFFLFITKQTKEKHLKIPALLTILISLIPCFLALKGVNLYKEIALLYAYNLSNLKLFEITFLLFVFPSWIIMITGYILFTRSNVLLKIILCTVITISLNSGYFVFFNSLQTSLEKADFNKGLGSIKELNLIQKEPSRKILLLNNSGYIHSIDISPEYKNIPLTYKNYQTLQKFYFSKPFSFLTSDINYFFLNYFLYKLDISSYRKHLLTCYLQRKDLINSLLLFKFVKTNSYPGKIPEILDHEFINKDIPISKITCGVMAIMFNRIDNIRQADKYWGLFTKNPPEKYNNYQVLNWINKTKESSLTPTIFSGRLLLNNEPLKNTKLILFSKRSFDEIVQNGSKQNPLPASIFMRSLYDTTITAEDGSFSLITWPCDPVALAIDFKQNSKNIKPIDNLTNYSCGTSVNLENINLELK